MLRKLALLFTLMCVYLLVNSLAIVASDEDFTIYGNEAALANNIVLTIDDASIETNVRKMFQLLQAHGITATFFPNTRYLQHQDPQLWQTIVSAGFEIGYHTRNHTSFMTPDALETDFAQFQSEIRGLLNNPSYTIRYVRPPNGVWDDNWMAWANAHQLQTVHWNLTMMTNDPLYIDAVLRNRERGGSIILLHTGEADVQWLHDNLPYLMHLQTEQQMPYRITSLSNAMQD